MSLWAALRRHPVTALTALVAAVLPDPLPERILGVVAAVALMGLAESRLGSRRTLVVALTGSAAAIGAAAALTSVAEHVPAGWAHDVVAHADVSPITPSLAAVMAASAVLSPLWRRRIRLLGFAAIIALVLYDGRPSSLYALIGALVGLAAGRVIRRGTRAPVGWSQSTRHEARVLLSGVVALTAIGPLITLSARAPAGVLAPLGGLFEDRYSVSRSAAQRCADIGQALFARGTSAGSCVRDMALADLHGPGTIALSVLPLATLLVAAAFIRRGSRLAVIAAVTVNLLLAGLAAVYYAVLPLAVDPAGSERGARFRLLFVHGLSIVTPLAVAVVLLVFLRHFAVRTPRRVTAAYLGVVAVAFAALSALYVGVAASHLGEFRPSSGLGDVILLTPQRFVPLGYLGPEHLGPVPAGGVARVAFESVGAVFWLVVAGGLAVAAGRTAVRGAGARDRADLRRLLRQGAPGAMSHMATWPGNSLWFAPDRTAAVAYRRVGSTAITLGDPLCDPDAAPSVVLGFARWCDEHGLTPVFYSVDADLEPTFARLGWRTMPIAEETVIRTATFSMTGKKWQDVRSSINRAATRDIEAVWTRYADLGAGQLDQIEQLSEDWVAGKRLPELGFTLGGLEEMDDPDVRLMLAVDDAGRVLAVTSWLPTWRAGVVVGWTLDFMRRQDDAMNGIMEFLIAQVALRAQQDGVEFVSLSAAPLATVPGEAGATSQTERLLAALSRMLEPAYGFRSLLTFKLKFQPELSPLLMAYPDPVQLPAIATALTRAYLPGLSPRTVAALLAP
ncbi:bifunctional lysylphosphatidylglycerol flippase/synthetase MprF [Frondihabitans australicus]|uniref:bifunctional lysylphosphatidylglycerol flippase/synthetase MprF n=1 Tax=Frondihabitans australicus TaxID=386892 RepID=UPI0011C400FE|nr:DUF2156 domain-containing protein [Frondihabitans australicus]